MKGSARIIFIVVIAFIMVIAAACSQNQEGQSTNSSNQSGGSTSTNDSVSNDSISEQSKETIILEFVTNASGSTLEAYQQLAEQFNHENSHIHVEVEAPGSNFGQLMSARMASNDLPDLWTTHGWAVHRYGEYLRSLNDQEWSEQLVDEIIPIISDSDGNLMALPFDVDISGMIYNQQVLEDLGIEVPETWDAFFDALDTVKSAGLTPIHVGGKDTGDVAGFMSRVAVSLLVMGEEISYGDAMQDGTFDWSEFDKVSNFMLELQSNNYLNVDHLTADKQETFVSMAQNQTAFAFQSNLSISEILNLNPEARISMMRIPVSHGEPFLVSGERNAIGVWKDTAYEEEALSFLEFMAKPESVKTVAESYSLPAAFKNVEVSLGALEEVFDAFENARVTNHFDREYLPNGMWSTLNTVGPGLLSKELNVEEAAAAMKNDYDRLRSGG